MATTINPYKAFGREDIFIGEKVNTAQFLPSNSEEEYIESGKETVEMLLQLYRKKSKKKLRNVLEVGSGDGRLAMHMASKCESITCLDINSFVLEAIQRRLEGIGITNAKYALSTEFESENEFDLIYSLQCLQHNNTEGRLEILNTILKALKLNGVAIIHFPKLENKPDYDMTCPTCQCFLREEIEEYGKLFTSYEIEEFNLNPEDVDYYLIVRK